MSGTGVIRYLLAQNAALTAVIPASRIRVGDLPVNTVLPAIGVKQITSVPQNLINLNDTGRMNTDRVQVTLKFKDTAASGTGYPGLDAAMKLVRAAIQSQRATIAGVKVDSIALGGEGPHLQYEDTQTHERSVDYMVRWTG